MRFASVPVDLQGSTGTPMVSGVAMNVKEKVLIIWVLGLILIAFLMRHFWSGATYLCEHAIAFTLGSMPSLLHFLAGHLR
jgi:hypothetical protein